MTGIRCAAISLLIALGALVPAPPTAAAAPPELPTALEASGAYNAWYGEPCRRLIDQCEDYVDPTGAEHVSALSCRRLGPDRARCRFAVSDAYRCRAVFRDVAGAYGRSWVAERARRGGVPYVLNVRCREIG